MDIDSLLTEQEKIFLCRAAKRKKLFLISSIATVVVALSFLAYHGIIAHDMNGLRFGVIIILLLSGRTYLRLYKSAVIFSKLKPGPATEQSNHA
jgi:hypothetical protein